MFLCVAMLAQVFNFCVDFKCVFHAIVMSWPCDLFLKEGKNVDEEEEEAKKKTKKKKVKKKRESWHAASGGVRWQDLPEEEKEEEEQEEEEGRFPMLGPDTLEEKKQHLLGKKQIKSKH